ncbi:hypothetical protein AB3S75_035475 [Citrus x aurantiifolia]
MASDAQQQDSHRKNRRSASDDEAEKSSKRHKHRHHHHRHRHHRSKKHENETKNGGEDIAPPVLDNNSVRIDDDVEEGEILDEDNLETKKFESGEIQAVGLRDGVNSRNPGVGEDAFKDNIGKQIGDDVVTNSICDKVYNEQHGNGDLPCENGRENYKQQRESKSPSRRSAKRNSYHDFDPMEDDQSYLHDRRKSVSSESSGDKYSPALRSPSRDRSYDEYHTRRGRSRSHDVVKERSRSQSVMEEEAPLKRRNYHERDANDSEDERLVRRGRNERHGSRDLVRDDEWEHRTSYTTRYVGREDRHHSREIERERRREREREKSKHLEVDRERRRDKNRERSRDRDIHRGREERDRSRYEEVDRGRRREKERDRSRDRARANDRDMDGQRDREKDRVRDNNLERERERRRDRSRDKGRDIESDREKGASPKDSYSNRDRYKHSRHLKHDDDKGSYRDRTRKDDLAKIHSSNSYSMEGSGDKITKDEDEQDDFEERVALKLEEQEEEDLDRIMEESRKRRQAILEKYKNQQLQQQKDSNLVDVETDEKPSEHSSQSIDVNNKLQNDSNGRIDGVNVHLADQSFSVKKSPPQNGVTALDKTSVRGGLGDGSPKSETSNHIPCDDIFGETPVGVRKTGKAEGLKIIRSGLHDNWDDAEGYYSYRFGEILDGRYEVTAAHGKGVFSTVVRAKDLKAGNGEPEEVAIKIIRNNETMNKAGQTEVQILKKLAVRAYAKQLFIALKHLKNCGVLHCDIKPDNMLVNEAKNVLKLCDFGNAMFAGKNEITPYLVSRFYRAPEIILGLPYDHPLDIWSVGCCLYELYTGKVLFPGATNNDMLRLHMELKGPFPKKMLRKGAFTDQHFDQDLNFHATEEDPVTKKAIKKIIFNIKPKDIGSIVTASPGEDPKMLANFKDLLDKIFVLDPEKRMTVAQALTHPFISGKYLIIGHYLSLFFYAGL